MREFRCQSCGRKLVIPDDFAYQRARCPSCRAVVEVPPTPPGEAEQVKAAAEAPRAVDGARHVREPLDKPEPSLGPRAYLPEQIVRVLRQEEKVIYWGRPSWVVLAIREAWLLFGVLFLTAAVAHLFLLISRWAGEISDTLPGPFAHPWLLILLLFLLVLFIIVLPLGVILFWSWRNTVYVLTSHRLLSRTGILALDVVSMPLVKVKSISLHRGLIQRLFGLGSLCLSS
jgi:phage FluMu protein Com